MMKAGINMDMVLLAIESVCYSKCAHIQDGGNTMPNKNVRFDYFRVYQIDEENGEEAVFDLSHLIERVEGLQETNRGGLRAQTSSGVIRLIRCRLVDQAGVYYALSFIKHKTFLVPGIASFDDNDIRDLNLGAGEFITMDLNILYHTGLRVLMMQRNRQVASPRVFAEYIKRVMGANGLNFELRPLVAERNIQRMNAANEVTQMTVRLDVIPEVERGLGGTLGRILNGFGADSIELTLKRRKGNGGLNRARIAESAVNAGDQFTKYSIDIVNDEGPDAIDFLNDIIHDMIPFALDVGARLYSEDAVARMQERFDNKLGVILQLTRTGGQ